MGATIAVDFVCSMNHSGTWWSGEVLHRQGLNNVKLSAGAVMSGIGYAKIREFFRILEIPFVCSQVFHNLNKTWLYPVIHRDYLAMRCNTISKLKRVDDLKLSGDAQFDSPGYSAKFCTYTIMQSDTNIVVDFLAIQKGQYQGELEKNACEELLNILVNEDNLKIASFVTDRHTAIAKMVREDFPDIFHGYDIWHVAKSLRKKLEKKGKKFDKIKHWMNSILNHFWWCCRVCKGDPDVLIELFHSLLFHVLNIHAWGNRRKIFKLFDTMKGNRPYPKAPALAKQDQKCWHSAMTKGADRKVSWLKVEEDDFVALFKVITDTRFSNDIRHCSQFLHTGVLEALHSSKLKYLPKYKGYSMLATITLTMLTVIEHNKHVTTLEKVFREYPAYSRAQKKYVLKKVTKRDSVELKKEILNSVADYVKRNEKLPIQTLGHIRKPIPKTFHGTPKPSKQELLNERLTRMSKPVSNIKLSR